MAINFKQHTSYSTITPFLENNEVSGLYMTGNAAVIYPNPATDNLYVKLDDRAASNAVVTVTDVAGREVHKQRLNTLPGKSKKTLMTWPRGSISSQ